MSDHTKGKLIVDVHKNILCDGGQMVAFPCISGGLNQEANARRLTACWNTCELMPTEDIERLADIGEGVMRLSVLADSYRAERDQMREERTAWRVTAENAEAAVKQARIDALEEAKQACDVSEPGWTGYECPNTFQDGVRACEVAIESLKEAP